MVVKINLIIQKYEDNALVNTITDENKTFPYVLWIFSCITDHTLCIRRMMMAKVHEVRASYSRTYKN